jgi:protein ImuA
LLAKMACMTFGAASSGISSLDGVLGGGLARGCVHEIYAPQDDGATAIGFAMALASRLNEGRGSPALWLRSARAMRLGGVVQAQGWAELGGIPGMSLLGTVHDGMTLLRAVVDALRCSALGVVIAESWGTLRELDLTASRRLALAAEKSGVTLLLLRLDAAPVPSAAQTRWQVSSAPSQALPGQAPGMPAFDITLLRQKSGPCGMRWRLEWDRDHRTFREAPLSGALVSVSAERPAAAGAGERQLFHGKSAA